MQKLLATIVLAFSFTACLHASESTPPLTIELSDPKVRITIPGIPEIDMEVHPMNEDEPIFRLRGNAGTTSISVITPKIDKAITPLACANAIVEMVVSQSAATRDQLFLGRADEKTFLIIYGLPIEQAVLLNTHIISAVDTTQCIEAHVSEISTSDADIKPWFNGFGESKIENF